jgi:chemotaxis protein methyltransferase CheR
VTAWSHPAFEKVAHVVGVHTGLSFASNRAADAEAKIRRAMFRARVSDVLQYLTLVEANSASLDDLVVEFTVGETYFFREPQHFDFIRREIFPDVLRRRGPAHSLRIWSAGCASGEEAYSLAIALEDDELDGHVLATDISRAALRKAREATYRRWSLRGLEDTLVRRCFHEAGGRWTLDNRFRARVTYELHNLARSADPSVPAGIRGMDLILCRNVLIYLEKESVSRVARGLSESLAHGGWLVTGPSDPPLNAIASLSAVVTDSGVFYRKSDSCSPETFTCAPAGTRPLEAPPYGAPAPGVVATPDTPPRPAVADVRASFAAGHYERVLHLTEQVDDDAAAALRVRAMANWHGTKAASTEVARHLERYPLSTELHLLRALLQIDLKRDAEAVHALRRALYLDRSLAIASFLLASVLHRQGHLEEARRAYRNARDLARARPADEQLPFSDGERAGTIAEIAAAAIARIDGHGVEAS